jgi:hypothetical protein
MSQGSGTSSAIQPHVTKALSWMTGQMFGAMNPAAPAACASLQQSIAPLTMMLAFGFLIVKPGQMLQTGTFFSRQPHVTKALSWMTGQTFGAMNPAAPAACASLQQSIAPLTMMLAFGFLIVKPGQMSQDVPGQGKVGWWLPFPCKK